jgi:lipoprotein signal peptidase
MRVVLRSSVVLFAAVICATLAIDLAIKWAVVEGPVEFVYLHEGHEIPATLVFGQLAVCALLVSRWPFSAPAVIAFGLYAGGSLANCLDEMATGAVHDFIPLPGSTAVELLGGPWVISTPYFVNLADLFSGAGLTAAVAIAAAHLRSA